MPENYKDKSAFLIRGDRRLPQRDRGMYTIRGIEQLPDNHETDSLKSFKVEQLLDRKYPGWYYAEPLLEAYSADDIIQQSLDDDGLSQA